MSTFARCNMICLLAVLLGCSRAETARFDPRLEFGDEPVVSFVDTDFAEVDREKALWSIIGRPENKRFDDAKGTNWTEQFGKFQTRLIAIAKEKNLDTDTLAACLERIFREGNGNEALLPISAYLARYTDLPVWVVVCRWEDNVMLERRPDLSLVHIRAWAMDAKTQKEIAFVTCD